MIFLLTKHEMTKYTNQGQFNFLPIFKGRVINNNNNNKKYFTQQKKDIIVTKTLN